MKSDSFVTFGYAPLTKFTAIFQRTGKNQLLFASNGLKHVLVIYHDRKKHVKQTQVS